DELAGVPRAHTIGAVLPPCSAACRLADSVGRLRYAPARVAAGGADPVGAHGFDRAGAQRLGVDGGVGALVAAGWGVPPVERRGAEGAVGGRAVAGCAAPPGRRWRARRVGGAAVVPPHVRWIVVPARLWAVGVAGPGVLAGGAGGVEVKTPVPRPGGDRQKRRGRPELIAESADRRVGPHPCDQVPDSPLAGG